MQYKTSTKYVWKTVFWCGICHYSKKKKKKETRAIKYNVLEYDQNTLKF